MKLREPQIKITSVNYKVGWLRGLFDGEGGWNVSRRKEGKVYDNYKCRVLSVINSSYEIIETAKIYLNELGIETASIIKTQNKIPKKDGFLRKPIYHLRIQKRKDVKRFVKLIGFTEPRKRKIADEIINSYIKDNIRAKAPIRKIRFFYYIKKLSQKKVAEKIGVSYSLIRDLMEEYDLPRRHDINQYSELWFRSMNHKI